MRNQLHMVAASTGERSRTFANGRALSIQDLRQFWRTIRL